MKRVRNKALRARKGRKSGSRVEEEVKVEDKNEERSDLNVSDTLSLAGTTGHGSVLGTGDHRSSTIGTDMNAFLSNNSGSSSASSNRNSFLGSPVDYDSDSESQMSMDEERDLSGFDIEEDDTKKGARGRYDRKPAIRPLPHPKSVTAEIESVANSLFLTVADADQKSPPYRVINSSSSMVISFKQRGTDGHPWIYLQPGESVSYMWEEPMKPRKLNLRVCEIDVFGRLGGSRSQLRKKRMWGIDGEYDNRGSYGLCKVIKLDEIGFTDTVPKVGVKDETKENSLWCSILADGPTKVLKISDREGNKEEEEEFTKYQSTISREQKNLKAALKMVDELRKLLPKEDERKPPSSLTAPQDAADQDSLLQKLESGQEEVS